MDPLERSRFFPDQLGFRTIPEGTIPREGLVEQTPFSTGHENREPIETIPLELDEDVLARGQERYGIYCQHCHGFAGYGDGMVVQRGFPAPPSYHVERLREAPAGHFFRVVTDGHGRMPAFGNRIPLRDRWAIIAYVQALQLSQHAVLNELPESDRTKISNLKAKQDQ